MAVRQRVVEEFLCNQARGMGDVGEEKRSDLIGDRAEGPIIDVSRIGAGPHRDHLRFFTGRDGLHLVVVNPPRLFLHPVGDELVELAGKVHR